METVQPKVVATKTKYAGHYKIGIRPGKLAPHNLKSWRVIEAILDAYGAAEFWDLAVAIRPHEFRTQRNRGPQSFVRYCIRSGWIERT